jgi:hypothetical protein
MNAYWNIDYEHDKQWEKDITEEPLPEKKEPDYSHIDRLFARLDKMREGK